MIEEPEWMKILKPDALVSVRDVSKIFGVCSNTIKYRIKNGSFIKPHTTAIDMNAKGKQAKRFGFEIVPIGYRQDKFYFKVSDVRQFMKEYEK